MAKQKKNKEEETKVLEEIPVVTDAEVVEIVETPVEKEVVEVVEVKEVKEVVEPVLWNPVKEQDTELWSPEKQREQTEEEKEKELELEKEKEAEKVQDNLYSVTYELDGLVYQTDERALSQEDAERVVQERLDTVYRGHKGRVLK